MYLYLATVNRIFQSETSMTIFGKSTFKFIPVKRPTEIIQYIGRVIKQDSIMATGLLMKNQTQNLSILTKYGDIGW